MTASTNTGAATLAFLALLGAVLASAAPAEAGCEPRHVAAIGTAGAVALETADIPRQPASSFRPADGRRPACTTAVGGGRDADGRPFQRRVTVCG